MFNLFAMVLFQNSYFKILHCTMPNKEMNAFPALLFDVEEETLLFHLNNYKKKHENDGFKWYTHFVWIERSNHDTVIYFSFARVASYGLILIINPSNKNRINISSTTWLTTKCKAMDLLWGNAPLSNECLCHFLLITFQCHPICKHKHMQF